MQILPETDARANPQGHPMSAQGEWQPIETAPLDGTFVDLWLGNDENPHRITDAYWGRPYHTCGEAGQYCDSCPPNKDVWCDSCFPTEEDGYQPTHWMPLPTPPTEGA